MSDFILPDVGEGISEGTLVKWLVKEGDTVKTDQTLAELETDKAVVEIPSPQDGTISKLHAGAGEVMYVGKPFVSFGDGKEPTEPAPKGAGVVGDIPEYTGPEPGKEEFVLKTGESFKDLNDLASQLKAMDEKTFSHHVTSDRNDFANWIKDVHGDAALASQVSSAHTKEELLSLLSTPAIKAMPRVRKMAKEKGIDLSTITGSGESGEILEKDLTLPSKPEPIQTKADLNKYGEVETIPVGKIRGIIAKNMMHSQQQTAFLAHIDEADVSDLITLQKKYKDEYKKQGIHLSLLPFVVHAIVSALKKYPSVNSEFSDSAITLKKYYNIGIAVDTEKGLVVPNIKNADQLSIIDLAKEISFLAEVAREGRLKLNQMSGGSFTVTNVGSVGGLYATPIINYPEVGILALGRTVRRPCVVGEEVKVRSIMPLSLSFDHRVFDGAYAAKFVNCVKTYLENPDKLALE